LPAHPAGCPGFGTLLRRSLAASWPDQRPVLFDDVSQSARGADDGNGFGGLGDGSHDCDGQSQATGAAWIGEDRGRSIGPSQQTLKLDSCWSTASGPSASTLGQDSRRNTTTDEWDRSRASL